MLLGGMTDAMPAIMNVPETAGRSGWTREGFERQGGGEAYVEADLYTLADPPWATSLLLGSRCHQYLDPKTCTNSS